MYYTDFTVEMTSTEMLDKALQNCTPKKYARLLLEGAEIIKQLRRERDEARSKEPMWIPVDEKKPEPYETVIVSVATRNGYEEPMSFETLAAYERRTDVWQDGLDGSTLTKADYERVTHWMPMPEPPVEDWYETTKP